MERKESSSTVGGNVNWHSHYGEQYVYMCSKSLPCPGYYKHCCDERWGTRVSFNSGLLSVYAQEWDCWIKRQFYFQVF